MKRTIFILTIFAGLICFSCQELNAQADSLAKAKLDSLARQYDPSGKIKEALKDGKNGLLQEIDLKKPVREAGVAIADLKGAAFSKIKLLDGGKPFLFNKGTLLAQFTYPRDTFGIGLGNYRASNGITDYSLTADISAAGIPFTLAADAGNGFYSNGNAPLNDFYSFNFDTEKYRELLRAEVMRKIKPEQVLSTLMGRIDKIRHDYEQKLMNELNNVQQEFRERSGELIAVPVDITDLSKTDLTSIRASLFKDDLPEKYAQQLARLQEIKVMADSGSISLERKNVEDAIGKYEAKEKMFALFKEKKEQFESNKIVSELKSHLPFTPAKYREYLSKPGNLKDIIQQYGSLSSIQSLFLSLTKLDLGQNPVQSGELNMRGLLNTGVNTAFEGTRAKAGLIVGKNNNVNNWMQGGLSSIVSNEYSGLTGFSLGTGTSSRTEQSVSLNLFNFMNTPGMNDPLQQYRANYLPNAPRQDAVITYKSTFNLSPKHKLKVDLSKSFGAYKNQQNEDSVSTGKNAAGGLFNNNGKANYAAMITYDGEVFNTPLQVIVKKVGLGYSNPGNIFLRRGETEFQLALNRKFLKQKLNVRYKTDYRHQQFDPEKRFIANTFSNKLQANYRFRKNTRIGLSYQRSDYQTTGINRAGGDGLSTNLQADGSYKFSVAGNIISSTSTLSIQSMTLPMSTGEMYRNRTLLAVHTSSIPMQRNMLLLTFMGNQSNNKDYYFNTAFVNSEASYVYTLNKSIRLSSGAGFYYNKGWNSQIGLKQSVTATLMQRLEADISIDGKKAVRVVRTELANQLLIYSSVRYRF